MALSTVEAEYIAAAACCSRYFQDFGMSLRTVPLKCDNTSAINISIYHVHHSRTKHIEIRHHFVHDHVEKGSIEMEHCRTENQVADIFTKALDRQPFEHLRMLLGMILLN